VAGASAGTGGGGAVLCGSRARLATLSLRTLSAAGLVRTPTAATGSGAGGGGGGGGGGRASRGSGGGSRSSRSSAEGGGGAASELPPAVLQKAEDVAADRFRRSWPTLLRGPLAVLRAAAGWADDAWVAWLRAPRAAGGGGAG
jgi:hypothetical protein